MSSDQMLRVERSANSWPACTDCHSDTPNFSAAATRRREASTYPVPANARGPDVGEAGHVMEELADGAVWLGDGLYQSLFVVNDEGIFVVDAPPTLGSIILRAIAKVTHKPVRAVGYGHEQSDHVGAMSIYRDDVPYDAHRARSTRLIALADPRWPVPTRTFDDIMNVDAGDHSLRMDHPGPNHAEATSSSTPRDSAC